MAEENSQANRVAAVAMDGSSESEAALEFFVKNIYKENDKVMVMYCVHHKAQHDLESLWMPVDPNIIVHAYHKESKKADEVCKKLTEKLDTYQIGGKVLKLEGGDPGHVIVEECHRLGASLIVVGCRGLGTIRRKLLGSVSEYILHHSKVPVFVCRH